MTIIGLDPRDVLGFFDFVGAVVILWAMQRITTAAGFSTTQARWALFRRFVYCETAVALFGLGAERLLDEEWRSPNLIILFQGMVLFGVIIFPLLRAAEWINQDAFISIDGFGSPKSDGRVVSQFEI